jgi:DNA/RNA-binding domain of Phe-tRNA-synthetase-like protein
MVTTATTRGLLVVFAPREVEIARLTRVMDTTSERMQQYTGCRESGRLMVGS